MAGQTVIGGILEVLVDGEAIDISTDEIEVNTGEPMAKQIMGGHGRPVGTSLEPQEAFVTGEMHVVDFVKHQALLKKTNATVTVRFPHGTFVMANAVFSSEGSIKSSQSKMAFKFTGALGRWV